MDEADKPPDIESYVIASIAMWLEKMTPKECDNLAARHFSYECLTKFGVEKINESKLAKVVKNNDGLNSVLATRVVKAVNELKNLQQCPRFMVPPDQIELIPGIPLTGDTSVNEATVNSRLDSLEKNHELVMKTLNEIRQSVTMKNLPLIQAQVPSGQLNHITAPAIHLTPPTFGASNNIVNVADDRSRGRSSSTSSNRSAGTKRSRDEIEDNNENWAKVAARKGKSKVQKGNSKVTITPGENAILPFDVYIGNTHPKSNSEVIVKYLNECFEIASSEIKPEGPFEIMKIECCTKPRDDGKEPWCLNWRVTLDHRFSDYILKPDAIPVGWTSRRYYPPRAKRPPPAELHPAKVANTRQTALLQTAASAVQTTPDSGESISHNN